MGIPANVTPPVVEAKMIAALAAGLTADQVAKAFDVHPATVYRVAKRGDNPRLLQVLRDELRAKTLEAVKDTTPKLLDRLDRTIEDGTARDIDALSRAALNLEKVAASTSGETRRQEVNKRVRHVIEFAEWVPRDSERTIVIEADALPAERGLPQPSAGDTAEGD